MRGKSEIAETHYEIDPHNRLVAGLPRFRKVINGRFRLDKKNALSYHVKAPVPYGHSVPHQVKFRGKWSLTRAHDLRLTLDKWARRTFGDMLTLKGDIISVNKNSLLFSLTTKTKENKRSTYVLKMAGSWQADKNNRLTFKVKKEKGAHDILTFDNIWEINNHHRIVYRYRRAHLIRKSSRVRTLISKGHWDIRDKARLSYVIDKNTDSAFHFRPAVGIFKEKYIKYEVGIGLSHKANPVKRTVTLSGTWKIKKNLGLLFEVEYEKKKARAIVFGIEARPVPGGKILFRLKNTLGKDIGAELKLSREIFKGEGELFLRALKSPREKSVYTGMGGRW